MVSNNPQNRFLLTLRSMVYLQSARKNSEEKLIINVW